VKARSLRLRLFVATALSVSVALMLAFWGLGLLFDSHVRRRAIDELSVQLDQLLAGVDRAPDGQIVVAPLADARFNKPFGGRYWQIESARTILRSRSLWDFTLAMPASSPTPGGLVVTTLPGPADSRLLTIARTVRLPPRQGAFEMRVVVAMDTAGLTESGEEFREQLLPFTLLLAGFLVAAGFAQIAVGLRPLNEVERRVARVRAGEENRVGSDFPREIIPLAEEVDGLLEQRERDIRQARKRAGDLAHGLKTPLQALLGEARRLRADGNGEAAATIEQIADTMRRHVERELSRVRIAARAASERSDLGEALGGVIAVVQKAQPGPSLRWEVSVEEMPRVAAAREDLAEILGALLENAARHARSTVTITAGAQDDRGVVTIRDDGPGIPPERIGALMERGARADESGTGLGLAIARELTEALGGRLELSSPGGLQVRIALPLAP